MDDKLWRISYEDFDGGLRKIILDLHPTLLDPGNLPKRNGRNQRRFFLIIPVDRTLFFSCGIRTHFSTNYCSGRSLEHPTMAIVTIPYPLEEGEAIMAAPEPFSRYGPRLS